MTDTNIIKLFCVIKECCNFLTPEEKQHALGHLWQTPPPQPPMPYVRE